MTEILCYICCTVPGDSDLNIFSSASEHSKTLIYKFLEQFLSLDDDQLLHGSKGNHSKYISCPSCFQKINEYDWGVMVAEKAQLELISLLDAREAKTAKLQSIEDELIPDEPEEDEQTYEALIEEVFELPEELPEPPPSPPQKEEDIEPELEPKPKSKEIKKKPKTLKPLFSCSICNMKCRSQASLDVHTEGHKGISPYQCPICQKTFTQKIALIRHMPMHTGEKPYVCDLCKFNFFYFFLISSKISPFSGGKSFIHNSSFHMHKLAHAGVRNKKCETCGLMLRSASHLSRHMRVHTGEKPYSCPICGKSFAQRYNMTAHYKAHGGIHRKTSFPCDYCPDLQPFTRKWLLDKHLSEEHAIDASTSVKVNLSE